ncbi:MAG: histidine triad (HIT) family protein [Saprospiraceae bacterium]|jgi:histidine triad (HIT) family protein
MLSIFSKIIAGEIPCHKVAESEEYFAFLDIRPLQEGHTLVVPKLEVDRLFDLEEDTYSGLFRFTKQIAAAIKKAYPCDRVGMAVIGLEVPHAHIHLIPINAMSDMDFANPKISLSPAELADSAAKIGAFV